jgi:uncharacterized membrane protein
MPPPTAPFARLDRLDALRGAAMLWMAAFHFCFDLDFFGYIRQDFHTDPLWTRQRIAIVSLFLLCAGAGQAAALAQAQPWSCFWRRWRQIAACALLVSLGSWLMFPRSWISFGVLHGFALMLIAARLLAPLRAGLWPLGLLLVLLPQALAHPFFDSRATNWVGLVTHKPVTEDYAPLLPWLGVLLWGLAAGQWLLAHRPQWLRGVPRALRGCSWLGRHSLPFYMLHQPVLIVSLLLLSRLR